MTDFQYLTKGNNLLMQITRQRRWLVNNKLSGLSPDFAIQELKNIDHAKSIISTGSAMKAYLEKKKDTLSILISAVNTKYHNDLDTLTKTQINQSII
jgi:ribosomal protein S1